MKVSNGLNSSLLSKNLLKVIDKWHCYIIIHLLTYWCFSIAIGGLFLISRDYLFRLYLYTIPTYNSHFNSHLNSHFLFSRSGNSFLKNSHFSKKNSHFYLIRSGNLKWELQINRAIVVYKLHDYNRTLLEQTKSP